MLVANYFWSDRYKTNICVKPSVHRQCNWIEPAHVSFYRAYIDMYRKTSNYAVTVRVRFHQCVFRASVAAVVRLCTFFNDAFPLVRLSGRLGPRGLAKPRAERFFHRTVRLREQQFTINEEIMFFSQYV